MADFDLVIRGGTAATAVDVFRTDIGVRDGRIAALAADLPAGDREIDASGLLVLPGGIDSHCHLDQPTGDESVMADDFASGTRSAACGGTTTLMPFAAQMKGQSLRDAVLDYHRRAKGNAFLDYAFHLIVTDPTPQVVGQELPALIQDGYTSFKIYTTYDALKLSDREILDVLALARSERALVMIHAENADCISWLTERLERAGDVAPRFHAADRRARGDASGDRARRARRYADSDRTRVRQRGDRTDPLGEEPGPSHLRRNLPAISLSYGRRSRRARLSRREMRVQPAATGQGEPSRGLGRPPGRSLSSLLLRPRAVPLR
jgi:dihydroorotase-like cyclic amidohydrolase